MTPVSKHQPSVCSAREMGELWKFETFMLGPLERSLEGGAREIAVRKLTVCFRVCHAALQSCEINDTDFEILRQ
jgi:hypothetical protein